MLWTLGLAAIFISFVGAQPRSGGQPPLITPGQLREQYLRGGVVLLHVGERADYNASHIPGARFFPFRCSRSP